MDTLSGSGPVHRRGSLIAPLWSTGPLPPLTPWCSAPQGAGGGRRPDASIASAARIAASRLANTAAAAGIVANSSSLGLVRAQQVVSAPSWITMVTLSLNNAGATPLPAVDTASSTGKP
ncbi:hypothetical protein AB0K15_45180 [Amycolatopsis sp. NPDC049253]|uniref:hypothetical protein n=1 Tax=Amycolatopsis sp. NPDC049253 TaxID=3155274 RepID=UPI00343ACD54